MVRSDPFWDHVTKMDDGLQCNFCDLKLALTTSISRFKLHLSGVESLGVKICTGVPPDVKEAAFLANQNANKRPKTMASSSQNEPRNTGSTFSTEQSNGAEIPIPTVESTDFPLVENLSREFMQPVGTSSSPERLLVDAPNNIREDAFPTIDLVSQAPLQNWQQTYAYGMLMADDLPGNSRDNSKAVETTDFLLVEAAEPVENMSPEFMQPVGTSSSPERLLFDAPNIIREDAFPTTDLVSQVTLRDWQQTLALLMADDLPGNSRDNSRAELAPHAEIESLKETRGVAFLTKKLVGRMFERNKDKVWSLLKKDEVSSIGIYGMGGVGKTALMTHVYNRLLKGTSAFGNVSWVTVSQDFSIPKLQNLIAKTINLDLSHEEDEKKRAAKLFDVLNEKKYVIILDDVWHNFIPEDVGIPVRVNACKWIVTSRSVEVCRGVGCQEMMKIEPLSEEEAWTLFVEKLGCHVELPPEVTPIARSVAKECDGLPLGIITIAASMRGVDDVHEWRNVLTELKESKVGKDDMELKVFKVLKYSYLRLNDRGLRQSFLYCALFPEDCCISREDLINFMISEGIIERMRSRQAECDKGHAILNKLENVCLLEAAPSSFSLFGNGRCVKMHDLIRDMALQIMAVSPRAMVEAGAQLTELPDEEKWTCDLVRVSLMNNNIQEILSSRPSCPVLSTLLLRENSALKVIEDSFFQQFQGLKVLDLSDTAIQQLPSSISDSLKLTALLLRNCQQLRRLPSLAKLRALKMLDVSYAGLEEVPQGMELLSNLKYLNINNVILKAAFPTGILPHLLCLQSLNLHNTTIAKVEELAFLKMLETLECRFNNLLDFNTHLKSCEEKQPIIRYNYTIGGHRYHLRDVGDSSKQVLVVNCNISKDLVLPKCIKKFTIDRCQDVRSLCSVSLLKNAPELKCLDVKGCDRIECLLASSCSPNILESIDTLRFLNLRNLRFFIGARVAPETLAFSSTFSCLKKIKMLVCSSITKLFPHSLLQNLQNLEEMEIAECCKMEEIMASGEGDAVQDSNSIVNTEVRLPKLRCLVLRGLPELKSICSETLICDSLQEIRFVNCRKLKKIPLFLPLPSVAIIQAYPRDWWESLEWSHPNAFKILLRFCVFHNYDQRGVSKWKKASKSMESLASANAS